MKKKIERREMFTHPHPGGRKNTEMVHRVYIETTCEVKEKYLLPHCHWVDYV